MKTRKRGTKKNKRTRKKRGAGGCCSCLNKNKKKSARDEVATAAEIKPLIVRPVSTIRVPVPRTISMNDLSSLGISKEKETRLRRRTPSPCLFDDPRTLAHGTSDVNFALIGFDEHLKNLPAHIGGRRKKKTRKKRGGMKGKTDADGEADDCVICQFSLDNENEWTDQGSGNLMGGKVINVHAAPLPLNQPIPAGYYDEDGAKHFFHENCIANWTQNSLCPMCNQHMIIRGPAPQQMIVDEQDGFQEPACDGCPIVMATNDVRTSDSWRDVEGYGHLQSNGNYCNNCVENWICPTCNEIINHSYRYRPSGTFREQCPWCEVGQTYDQWAPENEPGYNEQIVCYNIATCQNSYDGSTQDALDVGWYGGENDEWYCPGCRQDWTCIYCNEVITPQERESGEFVHVPNNTGGTNPAHEQCAGEEAYLSDESMGSNPEGPTGGHGPTGGGKRRKKKTRKYKGNKYPYKNITKKEAVADFIKLKSTTNPRSLTGLEIVNYGTEKLRVRTKYRGKSLIQRWKDKKARKTLKKFANRLYKGSYTDSLFHAYRSAIALSWGTLSSMRTSAALQMYRKYNAKKVLDFTAGWGSRMTAALAADIDYIGIDSNKSLKKGYNKIIKATKKHTKSKVKLFFQPAETVNYSKLDYDFVFTSPPYEYLELYEHMKNYEGTKKIKQAHSATDKRRKNDGFYDTFLIPTIKEIYKHLPKGKWMCLNVPDLMYDKIKKKWKACNKKEDYMISKRVGSNMKSDDRRGQEFVYCWKKK